MLDLALIEEVRRLSPKNALRLLASFAAELPQRRQAVAEDFAGDKLAEAQRRLHAWKGTAGCMGARALRDALAAVEEALRAGDRDTALTQWRGAETAAEATATALEALLTRLRAEAPP